MKVVINKCYGGFSLSPKAVKRLADLKGKNCYFFTYDSNTGKYTRVSIEEAKKARWWLAYSVPNPEDYRLNERDEDGLFHSANKRAKQISIPYQRDVERNDPDLIKVIEELGDEANGTFAELKIIEVPDNTKYTIEEYDGIEWVSEEHSTWR